MHNYCSLDSQTLVDQLKSGAVGVLLTDTVYGLVCAAGDTAAVERLFVVKARQSNPGTILAATVQQLIDLGLRGRYVKAVEHYWPNPLSIVIPCGDNLTYLHQGKYSLAVRIPDDSSLRALLNQTGPLVTTSANHPGEPTARNIYEAKASFGDAVDFYVDGGECGERPASTIIRIVDDAVEVLRQGAVNIDENGRIHHK